MSFVHRMRLNTHTHRNYFVANATLFACIIMLPFKSGNKKLKKKKGHRKREEKVVGNDSIGLKR